MGESGRTRQLGMGLVWHGLWLRAYWFLSRRRLALLPVLDGGIWVGCITAATLLRYQFQLQLSLTFGLAVAVLVAGGLQVVFGFVLGLYRSQWRLGSFEELGALSRTVFFVTTGVTLVSIVPSQHLVPVSATIGGGALALVVSGGLRCLWRLSWERQQQPAPGAERAIIFGAGEGAVQVVTSLLTDPSSPYIPVALLDDDRAKRNLRVRHLKVCGTRHDLIDVAHRERADTVIMAIPSADGPLVRELSDLAVAAGLTLKVLPTTSQILAAPLTVSHIRPVTEADLLGRRGIDTEVELIAGYLSGKRVLVTGAGGWIGSELCRQIHRHAPASLVMLDRDESGLHQVQLSIEGRAMLDKRTLVVCDIRDPEALVEVFREHRPEVVFHAAALKHLPLLEMWPGEAVKTNVIGTQNVLDTARRVGVSRFVNVSTDKAVEPSSNLGYSKRIAERLTAGAGEAHGAGTYLSVRFGNVLGSRGSVLTTFRTQIDAGGPITVTDPDVTRYFMSVEEAVQLVIQAGAVGRSGEVLVLDMGEPVRIAEMAERLARQASQKVRIVYTGLRPGEKLHERLWGEGEVDERPGHPLLSHVRVPPLHFEAVMAAGLIGAGGDSRSGMVELCSHPSLLESFGS